MSDSVGQYLNEIGAVALLNAQEERELSQAIERGVEARIRKEEGEKGREIDKAIREAAAAKDRFIRANLRLVVSVARRYPLPPGMELLDLIQEGNLGLEHAVDKFDWRKGFKFSTYATFWIRQSIGRALDQKASLVRLPGDRSASLRAALRQVSGDGDELDDDHARLHRLTTPTSLDRTIGDDDSNELIDLLPDANPGPELEVMAKAEEEMVTGLLDILEPRAKYAVEQRFGLSDGIKRSYREVGEELGVTAEAARRLVKRAINAVREHAEELTRLFGRWVAAHTKEEVYRLAQRYGHAYGYVATARDMLDSPQLRHRRFFVQVRHPVAGRVTVPGAPFRMSRMPFVSRRAPLLGEHGGTSLPSRRERMGRSDGHEAGCLPLEGLRVVDFTHIWAGPYCTRILADLGAEVIKIESPRRGDGGRGQGVGRYHAYSRNKLAIAIDLRTDEGRRHIRKLIAMSDVVAENFSVGVTKRLGVDYADCRAITPSIVYIALPAFGRTGPGSGFVGMGATQEAMSGLLGISSYPGAVPSPTGVKYGDPNGGLLGAVAVLAALHHRAATGEGQLIDLSQREANIFTLPEPVLDYVLNGRTAEAGGGKRPDRAPTGCYPCKDDEWVAIDVETDRQFRALCAVVGRPDLAADRRFATPAQRKRNEGELDRIIESWTRKRSATSGMWLLQDAGVPAGAVLTNKQVAENEHFRARGFFQRDTEGRVHLAAPWRFSKVALGVRRFAPELGQDTLHVLRDILGVPEADIRAMERKGVIKR